MSEAGQEGGREVGQDGVEGDAVGAAGLEGAEGRVGVEVGAEVDCGGGEG